MPRGGKRTGAGRKICEETKQVRIPVSLVPLVNELVKLQRGRGDEYSSYLVLTLLDRAVGIPESFMGYARMIRNRGLSFVDRMIDALEPRTQRPDCPESSIKRLEDLKKVRELFKNQKGETLQDDREKSRPFGGPFW